VQRPRQPWTDEQVEQVIATLLRFGVMASATLVLMGGLVYLARHGNEAPQNHVFVGEPVEFESIAGIVRLALQGRGRGIIQLGLLLLIATPVARVIFSVYAFARQHDWTYVVVTLLVLAILLYSLVWANG
jgi:uncharacterized membrane protein